jgi:hypothetical protein
MSFPFLSMCLLFFNLSVFNKKKKKNLREDAELYFFLLISFQILLVFLPDNSVHCAFIKYAYTGSRAGQNLMIKAKGTFSLAMTQVLNATSFTIQIPAKL